MKIILAKLLANYLFSSHSTQHQELREASKMHNILAKVRE